MPGRRSAEDLTNAIIDRAPIPGAGERVILWDGLVPGLGLRILPSGRRVWFVKYRVRGLRDTKRYTIGEYGKLRGQVSLSAARDMAREVVSMARAGQDPNADAQREKEAPLFEAVAKDYVEKYARPRKRTWKRDEAMLRIDVLPVWGKRRITEIRRRDVIDLLDAIRERGAPVQANRTLACIRKLFNWAVSRDLIEFSPCGAVASPSQEHQRDRVLTAGEIRAVWRALDGERLVVAGLFRLHLLTAQRGGEVRAMRWADVDLDAGWWTIPAERAKNGLSHRVPLSAVAVDLLRQLKAETGDGDFVLPGGSHGRGAGPTGRPLAWAAKPMVRIREASGVSFVPHDLRRTAASWMASLGVQRLTISKLLNHAEGGVTRIYDRHSYDAEKKQALDLWAERLMGIVGS